MQQGYYARESKVQRGWRGVEDMSQLQRQKRFTKSCGDSDTWAMPRESVKYSHIGTVECTDQS